MATAELPSPQLVSVHIQMDPVVGPCGALTVAKLSDGSMQFAIAPHSPLAAPVVAVQAEAVERFIKSLVAAFLVPEELDG